MYVSGIIIRVVKTNTNLHNPTLSNLHLFFTVPRQHCFKFDGNFIPVCIYQLTHFLFIQQMEYPICLANTIQCLGCAAFLLVDSRNFAFIRNIPLNLIVYESVFQKCRVNCRYLWKRCYLYLKKEEKKSRAVRNLRENEVDIISRQTVKCCKESLKISRSDRHTLQLRTETVGI